MRLDNRKDYLLLLLYSEGSTKQTNEPIVGRTRLVKMLFLFKSEVLERFSRNQEELSFYEFFPWSYGPFSKQVYDDLKFFQLRGFISSVECDAETSPESVAEWEYLFELEQGKDAYFTEYVEEGFALTPKGCRFAEILYAGLTATQKSLLRDFKAKTSSAPLRALLKYVYSRYPEQTTRSVIKDDVFRGG